MSESVPAARSLLDRLGGRLGLDAVQVRVLPWGIALHGLLLGSLYLVRPLRDEMGIRSGVQDMQWLFSGTFVGLLVMVPSFGWAASRLGRRTLVVTVLLGLAVSFGGLYGLWHLASPDGRATVAAMTFVWLSIFNLLAVSVFWSWMADVFGPAGARRCFGVLAGGGSLGAVLGPLAATVVLEFLDPIDLLVVAGAVLVLTAIAAGKVGATAGTPAERDEPLGGGVLAGVRSVWQTPMLRGLTIYLLLMTWVSTTLYFEQARILADGIEASGDRAAVFARMDLAVNVLAIAGQLLLTARLLRGLGLASVLVALPMVSAGALVAVALAPTVGVLVGVQVVRRAVNYALAKPAREILYTAVDREAKYKGKNVVDTIVYRGGDAVAGWAFAGLSGLGLSLATIAWLAVPSTLLWARYARDLGRMARD